MHGGFERVAFGGRRKFEDLNCSCWQAFHTAEGVPVTFWTFIIAVFRLYVSGRSAEEFVDGDRGGVGAAGGGEAAGGVGGERGFGGGEPEGEP